MFVQKGCHVAKKEKSFDKSILIQSSGIRGLFLVPTYLLYIVYLIKKSWHMLECSRVFYMPRFVEENPSYSFLRHGTPSFYLRKRGQNTYLYPYLKNVNQRYEDLVKLIDMDGLNIVDVNAGHGNLIFYLPKNCRYRGNDIYPQALHVERSTDEIFVKSIEEVDVLCIFGWITGGAFVESETQDDSLEYLLEKYQPRYFVLEAISEYQDLMIRRFDRALQRYSKLSSFQYDVGGRHPHRTMLVFEFKGSAL